MIVFVLSILLSAMENTCFSTGKRKQEKEQKPEVPKLLPASVFFSDSARSSWTHSERHRQMPGPGTLPASLCKSPLLKAPEDPRVLDQGASGRQGSGLPAQALCPRCQFPWVLPEFPVLAQPECTQHRAPPPTTTYTHRRADRKGKGPRAARLPLG